MNIILLVFIILASMFVSSSVNNIVSVTTALDSYFEMADVPDYFAAIMNKASVENFDETIESAESIDSFKTEKVFYWSPSGVLRDGEPLGVTSNTHILQRDKDISMNYFLEDGSILETVPKGKFYTTVFAAEKTGLEAGDKVTFEI